jgi:hypothetical protein
VLRVDLRTGRVQDGLPVDGSLFGGIVIGDSYWISGNNGTIYRSDAGSGEVVDQLDLVGFGPRCGQPVDGGSPLEHRVPARRGRGLTLPRLRI